MSQGILASSARDLGMRGGIISWRFWTMATRRLTRRQKNANPGKGAGEPKGKGKKHEGGGKQGGGRNSSPQASQTPQIPGKYKKACPQGANCGHAIHEGECKFWHNLIEWKDLMDKHEAHTIAAEAFQNKGGGKEKGAKGDTKGKGKQEDSANNVDGGGSAGPRAKVKARPKLKLAGGKGKDF